ncbi:trehalose-phosphatase [Candidatus Uhrbacteria bacterium CG10_big_fil_rev_8_21_14_0_10_48_11]|uniref:Trehalose 6-phosphate phosphatase n=1 Tax=Candidatus Uhrbacteria bacterium CG10_big_fil_rev_8_21_14_0_10_48_11 TaxID=1975037 RepID=A0A2M8LE91_9BACT|nr:MAG: trehalose-phosphatase [Candidatus Uhrbacteria bacterium CG10_big_fil_rev_8_21_14_0_10_48_11]
MKYLFNEIATIQKKITQAKRVAALFDFDGTLAKIVKRYEDASLLPESRRELSKLSLHLPVVVISGRSLSYVKRKIGIGSVGYFGNHGLEWELNGQKGNATISESKRRAVREAKRLLLTVLRQYPMGVIEDKTITVTLHYRRVPRHQQKKIIEAAAEVLSPLLKKGLIVITRGKKVFEVRPAYAWDKGVAAKLFLRKVGPSVLPLYIGDDKTDEDAFRALHKGITIRVRKSVRSAAQYYVKNQSEVLLVLKYCNENFF